MNLSKGSEETRPKFSVLMSIYAGDVCNSVRRALKSIWDDQLVQPSEIVIVIDGPIPDKLDTVVANFQSVVGQGVVKLVRLGTNVGLAKALNEGLHYCSTELVARMDSDDVSLPHRFKAQIDFMIANPAVDVVGALIEEVHPGGRTSQVRKVPLSHNGIRLFARRRDPVSHPVVMFRRSAVLSCGGYPEFRRAQDYALWGRMLLDGYCFANINQVLLQMQFDPRATRKRGLNHLESEVQVFWYLYRIRFYSVLDLIAMVTTRVVLRSVPPRVRSVLYATLRKV